MKMRNRFETFSVLSRNQKEYWTSHKAQALKVLARWRFGYVPISGSLLAFAVIGRLPLWIAIASFFFYGILWAIDEDLRHRIPDRPYLKATSALLDQILFTAFLGYVAIRVALSQLQLITVASLFAIAIVMASSYELLPSEQMPRPRKKGSTWFYTGLGLLFSIICMFGLDLSFHNMYTVRWGINARILLLFLLLEGTLLLIGSVSAIFEQPISVSKLSPLRGDLVFGLLIDRLELGPVRSGLTYLIFFSVPLYAWSQARGRLLRDGLRSGFIEFSGGVAGYLFVVPVVLALTAYLFQLCREGLTEGADNVIPPDSRLKVLAWLEKERISSEARTILALVTLVAIFLYRFQLVKDPNWYWMESQPHCVDVLDLFLFEGLSAWVGFFIVGSAIGDGLIILRLIRELGKQDLILKPFHADGRWGVGKFGQCPLVISMVNSMSLIVPILLCRDLVHFGQGSSTKYAVALILPLAIASYLSVLLFAFVGSVWPIHVKLKNTKDKLLDSCTDILAPGIWLNEPEIRQRKANEISSIFCLRQELQKCPTWPYGVRGILRFISAYGITLAGLTGISAKLSKILPDLLAKLAK